MGPTGREYRVGRLEDQKVELLMKLEHRMTISAKDEVGRFIMSDTLKNLMRVYEELLREARIK
jgi:hypothetical protein